MTEKDYQEFVNGPDHARWSALRQRVLRGEYLEAEDRAFYEVVNRRLDEQEDQMLSQSYVRTARELHRKIAESEATLEQLRRTRETLAERIRELERKLEEPMRRALTPDTVVVEG
jgi:predicted RNase H-like nuclease (RuvC/YqgF family)